MNRTSPERLAFDLLLLHTDKNTPPPIRPRASRLGVQATAQSAMHSSNSRLTGSMRVGRRIGGDSNSSTSSIPAGNLVLPPQRGKEKPAMKPFRSFQAARLQMPAPASAYEDGERRHRPGESTVQHSSQGRSVERQQQVKEFERERHRAKMSRALVTLMSKLEDPSQLYRLQTMMQRWKVQRSLRSMEVALHYWKMGTRCSVLEKQHNLVQCWNTVSKWSSCARKSQEGSNLFAEINGVTLSLDHQVYAIEQALSNHAVEVIRDKMAYSDFYKASGGELLRQKISLEEERDELKKQLEQERMRCTWLEKQVEYMGKLAAQIDSQSGPASAYIPPEELIAMRAVAVESGTSESNNVAAPDDLTESEIGSQADLHVMAKVEQRSCKEGQYGHTIALAATANVFGIGTDAFTSPDNRTETADDKEIMTIQGPMVMFESESEGHLPTPSHEAASNSPEPLVISMTPMPQRSGFEEKGIDRIVASLRRPDSTATKALVFEENGPGHTSNKMQLIDCRVALNSTLSESSIISTPPLTPPLTSFENRREDKRTNRHSEIELPYQMSPREQIEDAFKSLERGDFIRPDSPRPSAATQEITLIRGANGGLGIGFAKWYVTGVCDGAGVMGVDMSAEKGKRLDATPRMRPHRCYEVTHLVPGGAAAASGQVKAGDFIHRVNDSHTSLLSVEEMTTEIKGIPGSKVTLVISSVPEDPEVSCGEEALSGLGGKLKQDDEDNQFSHEQLSQESAQTQLSAEDNSDTNAHQSMTKDTDDGGYKQMVDSFLSASSGNSSALKGVMLKRDFQGNIGIKLARRTDESKDPYIISEIKADGPADCSGELQVGDTLVKIDSQSISPLPSSQVAGLISGASHTWVSLVVLRPDEKSWPHTPSDSPQRDLWKSPPSSCNSNTECVERFGQEVGYMTGINKGMPMDLLPESGPTVVWSTSSVP